MKVALLTSVAAALLLCSVGTAEPQFVPLFNGKDLDGWVQRNGTAKYEVVDGTIVGTTVKGSPNSFLCTARDYGDFLLEFEAKVDVGLNSGVQIRSGQYAEETNTKIYRDGQFLDKTFEAGRVHGYQVEISDEKSGDSGGIFDEARRGWIENNGSDPAAAAAFQDNAWNHFRVSCMGDHIQVWVNGVQTTDLVDSYTLSGFIALQVHTYGGDTPKQVRWRNLRIADLGAHFWKPLWDGKNLDDWTTAGDGEWTVENGVLRGRNAAAGANGMLFHNRTYGDFTIRFKFNPGAGNSGFFFRCEKLDHAPSVAGFQAEIDPAGDTGGLYETGGRNWVARVEPEFIAAVLDPAGWNEMTVSAHGRRIAVHVNGRQTVELIDDPGRLEGLIAVQVHSNQQVEVAFKDFEILSE